MLDPSQAIIGWTVEVRDPEERLLEGGVVPDELYIRLHINIEKRQVDEIHVDIRDGPGDVRSQEAELALRRDLLVHFLPVDISVPLEGPFIKLTGFVRDVIPHVICDLTSEFYGLLDGSFIKRRGQDLQSYSPQNNSKTGTIIAETDRVLQHFLDKDDSALVQLDELL